MVLAAVVVGVVLGAGCAASESTPGGSDGTGSDSPAASLEITQPAGSYRVGSTDRTYIDDARPTAAHNGQPEIPSRTLPTLVLYPADGAATEAGTEPIADAPALSGNWPLILFAHGSTRTAESYLPTLSWWASAGYVVVAPNFPLSNEATPGGTLYSDYSSQTADESFVLDSVLDDRVAPLELAELVDPTRIGLGGQSFGAITTLGTVAAQCCADARVKAATEFAGLFLPYPSSGDSLAPEASSTPVLFVHGDADPTVPYDAGHAFWERLGAPGGFLTIVGGGHDAGFAGGGATPLDQLISDATLAFYDQHLKASEDAAIRFDSLVEDAGLQIVTFVRST